MKVLDGRSSLVGAAKNKAICARAARARVHTYERAHIARRVSHKRVEYFGRERVHEQKKDMDFSRETPR